MNFLLRELDSQCLGALFSKCGPGQPGARRVIKGGRDKRDGDTRTERPPVVVLEGPIVGS